jgi:tetratricopeptide (TPR) repeat protein
MNTFKSLVALVAIVFSLATVRVIADETVQIIAKGKQLLRTGTSKNDVPMLREAARYFVNAATTSPHKALCYYYASYANFRLVNTAKSEAEQDAFVDEAVKYAEQSLALDDKFADAHALLASCYGRKAKGMLGGMKYGPKASKSMEQALALAPNNPRVLMLNATSLYFKPEMWGGDKQKALEHWQKAAEIFDASPKQQTLQPDWGHEEAYAWIGYAMLESGNTDGAKAAFDRALSLNPDYGWVKYDLYAKLATK